MYRRSRRRARSETSPYSFHLLDHLFQIIRHFGQRLARTSIASVAFAPDIVFTLRTSRSLVRVIIAELRAAAFFSLHRRAGHRFRNREQILQIECGVPAGIEFAIAGNADPALRVPRVRSMPQAPIAFPLRRARCRPCPASSPANPLHRVWILARRRARMARALLARSSSIWSLSISPNEFSFANFAANSPARFPKTSRSESELPPSRFAPLIPAAHSPAANNPGTRDICVSESTRIPPMT